MEIPENLAHYLDQVTELAKAAKEAFCSNGPVDLPAIAEVVYDNEAIIVPVSFISESEEMHTMDVITESLRQIRRDKGSPNGVMVCIEGYGLKGPTEEDLKHHVRGSNAERFARGDPAVFEAVMLTVADASITVQRTVPFHYGDGTVQWDEMHTEAHPTMSTLALQSNMGMAIMGAFREEGVAN